MANASQDHRWIVVPSGSDLYCPVWRRIIHGEHHDHDR